MNAETFAPGDLVQLTPLGIRNGLTTRKGNTTGKVLQVFEKTLRVSRDGWGGPPGIYPMSVWRKKPTLTDAELLACQKK